MTEPLYYTPTPDDYAYTFGGVSPVGTLRTGQVLQVYTEDCFGGAVTAVDDLPSKAVRTPFNPTSGPFYIEDAEPGDTLAVHFLSIVPANTVGVSATFPHFGALTGTAATATLQPPLAEQVWLYPIDPDTKTVLYRARHSSFTASLPLDPMHGTVGVAPAGGEARSTIVPDRHGGNLDVRQIRAGATLYVGVNVPGALLALGDGHACQGGGEASGVAVEIAMRTTLAVEVIKGVPTPWPRIETDAAIMSIGAARPLEDAYRIAQHDLVGWTGRLTGLDTLDAYQLVAQAAQAPVGNVCDPNYTMVAALAKEHLPGITPYGDAHRRLRTTPLPQRRGGTLPREARRP